MYVTSFFRISASQESAVMNPFPTHSWQYVAIGDVDGGSFYARGDWIITSNDSASPPASQSGSRCAHLVHVTLLEEQLEHYGEVSHRRQAVHQVSDQFCCFGPVGHIEADVKCQARQGIVKLDDGH